MHACSITKEEFIETVFFGHNPSRWKQII